MNAVRAVRWTIAAVVLAGLAWQLSRQDLKALHELPDPSPVALAAALVLGGTSYIAFAAAWAQLRGRGESWYEVGSVWFASLFARYAPGSVWQVAIRVAGAHAAGESKRSTIELYGAEQLLACFSASALALALVALFRPDIDVRIVTALAAVAVVALAVVAIAESCGIAVGWTGRAVALTLAGHLAMSLGFATFVSAWTAIEPRTIVKSMLAFLVAGTAGLVAVFVPAGLGVREAVIAWLLAPQLGTASAIALALASRLWLLVCELGAWGVWAVRSTGLRR